MKVLFLLAVLHCLVLMNSGNPVGPGRRLGEAEKAGEAAGTHGHVPTGLCVCTGLGCRYPPPAPFSPPPQGSALGYFHLPCEECFKDRCEIKILPKARGTLVWDSQEAGTAG